MCESFPSIYLEEFTREGKVFHKDHMGTPHYGCSLNIYRLWECEFGTNNMHIIHKNI